ncbi:unnamed protein product [Bursaphelenchus okinawaensis]|uniref:Uncharacterized protein n=1 Tax=Bursaphelenchus okinawaensis TaxID=465554 RepID=A0A811KCZ6_9BILA|nr:unnamed protein product [Bursaphelenchus okinawaensis]CAG9101945.1 unnamed protein product [Bursaphelenchus okinawaensis]
MLRSVVTLIWITCFLPSAFSLTQPDGTDMCAKHLTVGESMFVASTGRYQTKLFKFQLSQPDYMFPFADAHFKLDQVPSDLHLNLWSSCEDYNKDESQYSLSNIIEWLFTNRKSNVIPAMNGIVGVSTARDYTINVEYDVVNPARFGMYIAACALFLLAKEICHRTVSVYTSSAFIGVFASIIVLALFLRRFLPRSILFIPMEWFIWPAISYAYYYGYSNIYELALHHYKFLAAYIVVAAVSSVTICYVSGVSQNVRLRNVFQWMLQAIAVGILFLASRSAVFSIGTILVLVTTVNGAHKLVFGAGKKLGSVVFKPKPVHKMYTEEEYQQQMEETTKAELEKLRVYLAENCRQLNSKTTPLRKIRARDAVGSFIVSGSDVSMASFQEHNRTFGNDEFSDDNSTDDSDDEISSPPKDSADYSADFTEDSDTAPSTYGWRREIINASPSPKRSPWRQNSREFSRIGR